MQTERIDLYYQQGSSDKVYHLQLENVEEQWSVNAQWGRRGSSLQSDTKASGVPYEEAKRVFDRVLREKTGKGYRVAETNGDASPAISVGMPTKEFSGHAPELLTPIEEREALDLVPNLSWWFQQKFDGRRLAVQKQNGEYSGINKLGQIIPIDKQLAAPSIMSRPTVFSWTERSPIPSSTRGTSWPTTDATCATSPTKSVMPA